ncbi:MAG: DNA replication and repair protein RecF [Candidatus Daviesbacteria bacterium]|nr:DNA replication and repair protein RecF [Candidatus Daviesbacteria bacterium]
MFLQTLNLSNFRNFSKAQVEFEELTLFIGDNAQGKSNILEAIYFLATTKSYKADKDSNLISSQQEVCRVEGELKENSMDLTQLEIVMQAAGTGSIVNTGGTGNVDEPSFLKRVKVNGVSKRVVDYIGNLVVIFFSPEDMNLIIGSPSTRRWHIDLTLAQVDRVYKKAISVYSEAITSRNRVLKRIREEVARAGELEYWTKQILENGLIIQQKRTEFFNNLNLQIPKLGLEAGFLKDLTLIYKESLISQERLETYQSREIAAATTLIGPHRDDFAMFAGERNLFLFGSRGEIRTAILDLKLAELEYVSQIKGSRAVLLLDDIFSELDEKHREYVVSLVSGQQTIITAIEKGEVPQSLLKKAKIITVSLGELV